jgi:hypothetical protein
MSKRKCGICGLDPAEGFASSWTKEAGEVFYCHGDDDGVSCYERASWSAAEPLAWLTAPTQGPAR